MFGLFKKAAPPKRFPPVPDWQPNFNAPLDRIVERLRHYSDHSKDIAVFENGTCVLLDDGLSDEDARTFALDILHRIYYAHLDFNPLAMKDGNTLVRYNLPAVNLVFEDVAKQNWQEIEQRHQSALATDEVVITGKGHNQFDDFGKKALYGRCFLFMDAQKPNVVRIERKLGNVAS